VPAVVVDHIGGQRNREENRPHSGAVRTALGAGVPLIPAALRGTDGWREHSRWHISVGTPIALDDLVAGDPGAAREATRRLWEAISALEAQLDRE
jgi:1-acyl-sn-glycerol-3-phosphate acyltransferase